MDSSAFGFTAGIDEAGFGGILTGSAYWEMQVATT